MKLILFISLFLTSNLCNSQMLVSGVITDRHGLPIEGANVYLEGTYDGVSTDAKGIFEFSTTEKGTQTLVVSFISYESYLNTAEVSSFTNLEIKLREDVSTLDAVEINAGSFQAGDNAKVTALKPLDVVTTASALGDVFGAFQTLPGTSANDEDGRLFVRGGDANETQIFIDGVKVFSPFLPTAGNVPTRGRFSAFLFKGMTFSTGGYSAEYGQALSSVLTLSTIDQPDQEKTEIQLMSVGAGLGNTQIWGKNSFSINTSYINLAPYQIAFPDQGNWIKPYEGLSGEMVYRYKTNTNGLLKLYSSFSYSALELIQEDINNSDGFNFGLHNRNLYINGSYNQRLNKGWSFFSGLSYGVDHSDIKLQEDEVKNQENAAHLKLKLKKRFSNRLKLNFGVDYFITGFDEMFTSKSRGRFDYEFSDNLLGLYSELDVFFSKKIAMKAGARLEHSKLFDQTTVSPRVSLAYKSAKNSQFSFAYGTFYQNPTAEYAKFTSAIKAEEALHFIGNYQYVKDKHVFRIEGYYKSYQQLIKYNDFNAGPNSNFSNSGSGFAKGIDIFWRDGKTIKNLEYWASYSFLDTKRDYKNYPVKARPNFASQHNLSLVGKYWVDAVKTQFGLTYRFATGRTYTNPNANGFLNQETPHYNSISMNAAYLISPQKILYASVNNVLGTQNIFNYRYKNQPESNGIYDRQAMVPNANRFFFIGFFWSISDDKKTNQLNNL